MSPKRSRAEIGAQAAGYFLINRDDGIGLLMLALAAAILSGGSVIAALWMAHAALASMASNAANEACRERCAKVCANPVHLP
jgi:hypothetical protein